MADPPVHRFPGREGLQLVYRKMGGHRVILPDLRGHGNSARPHDPVSYPPDVLADDGLALIEWLGLDD